MQSIELLTSFKRLRFRNIKIHSSIKVNRLIKHGLKYYFWLKPQLMSLIFGLMSSICGCLTHEVCGSITTDGIPLVVRLSPETFLTGPRLRKPSDYVDPWFGAQP